MGRTPPPRDPGLPTPRGMRLQQSWRLSPPAKPSVKAWRKGQEFTSCLAQGAGSLEDQKPLKSPGNGMLYNLQNQPLAWLRAAALTNMLRSPSASALGRELLQLRSSPLVLREDLSNLSPLFLPDPGGHRAPAAAHSIPWHLGHIPCVGGSNPSPTPSPTRSHSVHLPTPLSLSQAGDTSSSS